MNGLRQQAQWRLEGGELWLPLDLLEGQLGVSHRQRADGALSLEWFGQRLAVPRNQQRSLDDEVAVPVARLLQPLGLTVAVRGAELELNLPSRPLLAIRSRDLATGGRRVVFDLAGPGALRSG
ncbi:MAG: phosphodiester glycosidase family protein, partial [Vulcanococcus sp.]